MRPLIIGKLELDHPVIQAPMAGITDSAFRILTKRMGCPLVCSEMISDKALIYGNRATFNMLKVSSYERPISVQLFGSDPECMAQATEIVIEHCDPDIIDINMGCPTPKIVKNSEGSSLMRCLPLAGRIIQAVVGVANSYDKPVTVKMRLGWDYDNITVFDLVSIAEAEGVSAVTIHGRTREQFYSGRANWDLIGKVKSKAKIPVIGNGDIREPQDVLEMVARTNCDGVMVGRASLGNPWIFRRIKHFLLTGEIIDGPSIEERLDMIIEHAKLLTEEKGEVVASREMRKHVVWYVKGLPKAAKYREIANRISSITDLIEFVNDCRSQTHPHLTQV